MVPSQRGQQDTGIGRGEKGSGHRAEGEDGSDPGQPPSGSSGRSPGQSCRHCGEKIAIDAPDWRRNAGAGRFFVQITEVFPGEAVPLPALMAQLRAEGDDWDYFYLQD